MREKLLISDLHLSEQTPELLAIFVDFLSKIGARAHDLYILGDLFDAWIGDDDPAPVANEVRQALRALSDRGVSVFLQHGNRDFLIGQRFCRETGCTLLPDTVVHDINGVPTLLMHGDLLCTDDHDYQRLRRRFHSFWFRTLVRIKSLEARKRLANHYREQSQHHLAQKTADIMDVNQDTVVDYMRRFGVRRLIHGHTHRPARHDLVIDGEDAVRHVLPDWHGSEGFYMRTGGGELEVLPLNSGAT